MWRDEVWLCCCVSLWEPCGVVSLCINLVDVCRLLVGSRADCCRCFIEGACLARLCSFQKCGSWEVEGLKRSSSTERSGGAAPLSALEEQLHWALWRSSSTERSGGAAPLSALEEQDSVVRRQEQRLLSGPDFIHRDSDSALVHRAPLISSFQRLVCCSGGSARCLVSKKRLVHFVL